jgi:hypothetical protein
LNIPPLCDCDTVSLRTGKPVSLSTRMNDSVRPYPLAFRCLLVPLYAYFTTVRPSAVSLADEPHTRDRLDLLHDLLRHQSRRTSKPTASFVSSAYCLRFGRIT